MSYRRRTKFGDTNTRVRQPVGRKRLILPNARPAGRCPAEQDAAQARFDRAQERATRDMGFGGTETATLLSERLLRRLTDAILRSKGSGQLGSKFLAGLSQTLAALDPHVVAVATLQRAFSTVASHSHHVRDASYAIGRAIEAEVYKVWLYQTDRKMARQVEKRVIEGHGSYRYRLAAAKRLVRKKHKRAPKPFSSIEKLKAGGYLLDILINTLPDIFVVYSTPSQKRRGAELHLSLTDEALQHLDDIADFLVSSNPVVLPQTTQPSPWGGIHHDPEALGKIYPLIRTSDKAVLASVRAAIKRGQMQPVLDAVNRVQSVPFKINSKVLKVMQQCVAQGINVEGLPPMQDLERPTRDKPWEEMDDRERRLWRSKAAAVVAANRMYKGQRLNFAIDMQTAKSLEDAPAFWCLHSLDWRGRLYPFPHFNFQREDKVRSLFLFRDGAPIGERGLYWLKVHLANCGDFEKISKKSFDDRVAWIDRYWGNISATAIDPIENHWWMQADKPFLFLAACFELTEALKVGPEFVTHLPVSWDGTCSGLQHLSAMSRAEEGALVNLTPSPQPLDVYQNVADAATEAIGLDTSPLANLCLANGVNRKLVKRNVMTFPYSATSFGMGQQHIEDTMEPLGLKVLAGELPEHPYGEDGGKKAATFLARHTLAAIKQVVKKPAEVMGFLQKLARVMAHEGKVVEWTTPDGLPWSNNYYHPVHKRITLWLTDKGVRVPYVPKIADGYRKEVDKRRAEAAVSPNFVHACDATHLRLVVNAAYNEGIKTLATVHDSFGCLAPQSDLLHHTIREQFVRMYSDHNVLSEVLERCRFNLTSYNHDRLPNVVEYGSLELKDVMNAQYAFA